MIVILSRRLLVTYKAHTCSLHSTMRMRVF